MGNAKLLQSYVISECFLVEACITYERNMHNNIGEGVAGFGSMAADVLG